MRGMAGKPRLARSRHLGAAITLLATALTLSALAALAAPDPDALEGEVRYHASDQRSSWVGVAPLHVERLVVDLDDLGRSELVASVRVAELRSGNALRDLQARRTVFDAEAYPEVRFVLRRVENAADDPVADGSTDGSARALRLIGDLTVRDTTREVVAVARLEGDETDETVRATATLELSLETFGLPAPRLLTWVVDDLVRVEVDASWPRDRGSTATTRPPAPPTPGAVAKPPAASAARR